jgi:hypothetical protein
MVSGFTVLIHAAVALLLQFYVAVHATYGAG